MNTRRIVLGAVLLLGAVALGVDRVWLTPNAVDAAVRPAVAPRTAAMPRVPVQQVAAPAREVEPGRSGGVIAERLSRASQQRGVDPLRAVDAFEVPATWRSAAKPEAAPAAPAAPPDPATVFRMRHRLVAVMVGSSGAYAMVDDQTLLPGQVIDGFRLVRVDQRSALFEADGRTVELLVPSEDAGGAGRPR